MSVLDLELQASTCAVDSCFEKCYIGKEFVEIDFCSLRNDETFSKYVLLVPFIFITPTRFSKYSLVNSKSCMKRKIFTKRSVSRS